MIILLNACLGVGKSSVSWELNRLLEKSFMLDGDHLGAVQPFEIYDRERIADLYEAFETMVRFYYRRGYPHAVLNYVFESSNSLQDLLSRLRPIDEDIHVFWLTCDPQKQVRRIRRRGREDMDWELERMVELNEILESADRQGFIGERIDSSDLDVEELARSILMRARDGGGLPPR